MLSCHKKLFIDLSKHSLAHKIPIKSNKLSRTPGALGLEEWKRYYSVNSHFALWKWQSFLQSWSAWNDYEWSHQYLQETYWRKSTDASWQ